jgi:hypothetical protein
MSRYPESVHASTLKYFHGPVEVVIEDVEEGALETEGAAGRDDDIVSFSTAFVDMRGSEN